MSKNQEGYLGLQRGKLGTGVGYVIDGKQLYRAYIDTISNPRTDPQVFNRTRFAKLGVVAKTFNDAASIGFANVRKPLNNGINTFMSRNMEAVSGSTVDELQVEYAQLQVSDGSLPAPSFGTLRLEEALTVEVPFTSNSDHVGADAKDQVYVFVYQPDKNRGVLAPAVQRSAGRVSVSVPGSWSGMKVHVYGFARATMNKASDLGRIVTHTGDCSSTEYIGSGTIV